MLSRLAKSTTHFLVCKGISEREDEEVYAYGTELLYSAVLNILLAVIISLITDTLLPTFLFMLPFIIIRQCIGGYHAKTHIGCMAILGTVLIVFFQIVRYLPLKAEMPVAVTLTIVQVKIRPDNIHLNLYETCKKLFGRGIYETVCSISVVGRRIINVTGLLLGIQSA